MTVYVPNFFCYLTGLVILNKSRKRKLTGFFTDLEHLLKRSSVSVNSFLTVKFDKWGKTKHDATSEKLSTAQE